MKLEFEQLECDSCGATFKIAENIGTSSRYVHYCPACGVKDITIRTVEEEV